MLLKIIFAHLIGMGFVAPMNKTNNDRELYILYVIKGESSEVFAYEHCYEEEILEYIETHTFEYNEAIQFIDDKLVYPEDLIKNK